MNVILEEYFAATAETAAIATEHAENLQLAPQAQPIVTSPQDTTQQPHHPPLIGNNPNQGTNTTGQRQTTNTANNGLWFQNYQDTNQPRTSTTIQKPPINNMSPASSANMTEALTQLLTQVVSNKKDDISKQMMKNIKRFDGTNKTECINWLSQIEATTKVSSTSF